MVTWTGEISVGDILTVVAVSIAAMGLFLNYIQIRRNAQQKIAEYIVTLYNQYVTDPDLLDIFYKIEYDEFTFEKGSLEYDEEKKLDKLLGLFESIAKLHRMGMIKLDYLQYISYEYLVVYKNDDIRKYLDFIDEWCKEEEYSVRPFIDFKSVGQLLDGN